MPVVGIILVACEPGKSSGVMEKIKKVKGVSRMFPVFGRWDVVVKIEADDLRSLSDISLQINALKNVRATETLVSSI